MTSTSTTSTAPPAAPRGGSRWLGPILLANLVAEVGIVVTGGLVRVTGSGLGCPTWPECTDGSITPTIEQPEGFHKYIEFGNRTLTSVLVVLALASVVAVFLWAARRPMKVAALVVLGGVVVQAVLGGITVLVGLNPAVVAAHFLLSMGLVAASSYLWFARHEAAGPPRAARPAAGVAAGLGHRRRRRGRADPRHRGHRLRPALRRRRRAEPVRRSTRAPSRGCTPTSS